MYASRTGTRRNLAEIHARGWRLLASPPQLDYYRTPPPLAYALDNGAWSAHTGGTAFDGDAYLRALDAWALGADWIALPDVVMGGSASLDLSLSWLPRVRAHGRPMLLVVQDGMTPETVGPLVEDELAGIFVGGSTEWKEASLPMWGRWARGGGVLLHVGRVNSARRIRLCIEAGADSADGTSVTRFATSAARLDEAAMGRQGHLFGASCAELSGEVAETRSGAAQLSKR